MTNSEDPNGVRPPPELSTYTVMQLGGEGGDYIIVCDGLSTSPRYRRLKDTGEFQFFDDEAPSAEQLPGSGYSDTPSPLNSPENPFPWVNTLSEALKTINQGWPFLWPIFVHESHKAEIRAAWEDQFHASDSAPRRDSRATEQWLALLS